MVLLGTIVNAGAIAVGTLIGLVLNRIPERMKTTILQGLGLAVFVIGLSMALKATSSSSGNDLIYVIASLVFGGLIGEWINIEGKLEAVGKFFEKKLSRLGSGKVSEAFVFSSLVYCVGAMAIVGSLQSGLKGDHSILYTKAMLDGFSAIFFASAMGAGVLLSSLAVFLYQGTIAVLAFCLANVLSDPIIGCMSAAGGVLIMGIALNVMEIKKVNVANLLPAMFVAAIIKGVAMHLGWK